MNTESRASSPPSQLAVAGDHPEAAIGIQPRERRLAGPRSSNGLSPVAGPSRVARPLQAAGQLGVPQARARTTNRLIVHSGGLGDAT